MVVRLPEMVWQIPRPRRHLLTVALCAVTHALALVRILSVSDLVNLSCFSNQGFICRQLYGLYQRCVPESIHEGSSAAFHGARFVVPWYPLKHVNGLLWSYLNVAVSIVVVDEITVLSPPTDSAGLVSRQFSKSPTS